MNRFKLIEGKFSQQEAKDILINIYSEKINFHQLKNFSSEERFGKEDEFATKRIEELKTELERLKKILSDSNEENKKLFISSEIYVSVADQ